MTPPSSMKKTLSGRSVSTSYNRIPEIARMKYEMFSVEV
jgi:hypothetical protein